MKVEPKIMWAIYNPYFGFFIGTHVTKKEMIAEHCKDSGMTWEQCRRRGDVAMQVTVSRYRKIKS